MPNYWISFGIDRPRGYVRKLRYEGDAANDQVPFHSDFDVSPLPAEWVGRRYIGHLRSYLDRLERWPDLREAAERITAKLQQGRKVYFFSIGHMFPHEAPPDERAGPLTVMEAGHAQRVEAVQRVGQPGDMLFLLCMPTFDDEMVGAALGKGMEVIAVSGAPPPTALEQEKDLYWIAAPWPITDGCVEIPGYDMAILPVTGVMNAAIYYSVRSQVEYELALVED